jgi:hypothetical protein
MKLNFRQGIVRSKLISNVPAFLEYNHNQGTVDLDISDPNLLITLAHKDVNYLIEESASVSHAWGPFVWNSQWGMEPANPSYFLYWDVNLSSGEVSRGFSPSAPMVTTNEPPTKSRGSHWYDLTKNQMKYYDGTFWIPVCRVFAGVFSPNLQSLTHYPIGSQVGITSTVDEHVSGFIVVGNDRRAIKKSDGSLMTSDSDVIIKQGGYTSPVNIESLSTHVKAAEPIPEYHCVTLIALGKAILASSDDVDKKAIGISDRHAMPGEALRIISNGVVFNEQWDWEIENGRDLYCGHAGELIQSPTGSRGFKIGSVLTSRSIIVDLDEISGVSGSAGPTGPTGPTGPIGDTENLIDDTTVSSSSTYSSEKISELLSGLSGAVTIDINTFMLNPATVEIGSNISSVNLFWETNIVPDSITINGVSVGNTLTSYESIEPLTSDKTFVLSVSKNYVTKSKSSSVKFLNRYYWGTNENSSPTEAIVKSLNSQLSEQKTLSVTFDCNGGRYFYIAYPKRFGNAMFKVAGLTYTDYVLEEIEVMNESNYSETYFVYRSGVIQFGSGITVDVS